MNERAKQFSAFSPLKGYSDLLKEKEHVVVSEIELTEERKSELNLKLNQIKKGEIINVIYYSDKEYLSLTGVVTSIDLCFKKLYIVKTKVNFKEIYDIKIENERIF